MNFEKVINSRHSVRSFEPKKVPKLIMNSLIKDAIKAPSSSNSQPWKFYVVLNKDKRNKIARLLESFLVTHKNAFKDLSPKLQKIAHKFYQDLGGCQNIVFVYIKEGLKYRDSAISSVSCACENLMLSATDKGLGTCWVGSLKSYEKEINKILKVPKNQELVASILVGYPSKDFKPLKRSKKKISEVLKFV